VHRCKQFPPFGLWKPFVARFGLIDEWHLDSAKPLEHFEFDLLPRLRQAVVVLWPAFGHAGLKAIGAIGDAVRGDRPEHRLIEPFSVADAAVRLACNHWLKRFEDLERRLEADGSR
jgi:hypothetical protein